MSLLSERDLEFDFGSDISAIRFDDGATHATSSIQAVDFIVEYADRYMFVEVKDPDEPGVVNPEAFREKFRSGELVRKLAGKLRDSLFFRMIQSVEKKPIEYVVLLSMEVLDDAALLLKVDELKLSLPIQNPKWPEDCVKSCVIMNIRQWKRKFGDGAIRRLSSAAPIPAAIAQPRA